MQKKTKILAAMTAPCVLLATNLFAGITTTLDLSPDGYRDPNSQGGEFTAVVTGGGDYVANYNSKATAQVDVNGKTVTGFETFCVEISASFQPGNTYETTITPSIVSGPSSSTYITVGTAYLYSQFAQGKLSGYTYSTSGTGRELAADQLQDAIWYLQGEIGSNGNGLTSDSLYNFSASSDPFVTLVDNMFGKNTATESDIQYGNTFGVLALNLTSTNSQCQTVYNQDQLVYCPVPEPATFAAGAALLLPLGLSALRALRKKKENE
jgi:hypothetical protein